MIIFLIFIFHSLLYSQKINEFKIVNNKPESSWIEIYNDKKTDVSLDDVVFSNNSNSITLKKIFVPSKSFVLLCKNKNELLKKYNLDSDKVFEIDFPDFSDNKNTLKLYTNDLIIDSIFFDKANFDEKKSIERVNILEPNSEKNWKNSIAKYGSTPLKENSVMVVDFNISILNIDYDGEYVSIIFENNGNQKLEEFDFYFYFDWNFNKQIEENEVIFSQLNLEIEEVLNLKFKLEEITDINNIFGLTKVAAKIVNDYDEKDLDDYLEKIINIPPIPSSILFNEIMYEPADKQSEYIELFNTSNFDININKLSFHDLNNADKKLPFISDDYILKSKNYLVISSDSTILKNFKDIIDVNKTIIVNKSLSLNNTGDNLYLKWNNSKVIDSVFYLNTWHSENTLNTKGVSLEKKGIVLESNRKDNWTSSSNPFGGSPTMQNTVIPQDDGRYGLIFEKNPFSFVENDFVKISYFCPYPNSSINLSLFDKNGLKLGVIKELGKGGYSGEIHWNGKINNKVLPTGSYIMYFECINADTQELFIDKELFVIVN